MKSEKNKYNLTRYEQETIINCNAEEETASVYTCDPVRLRKMDALVKSDARVVVEENDGTCKTYQVPKKAIKVRLSRTISDENRKKLTLQLQAMRKKQKK